MKQTIRIDKLLSSLGLTSRRGVEQFIKSHKVTADGIKITEHGQRVSIHANITVNGQSMKKAKKEYYLLNKPKGVISTSSDEFGRKNVVSLIKTGTRIFPVGRLDRNTRGLLILTNDGELTNMLIHPKYHLPKTYQLAIKGNITHDQLKLLENGIQLEDGMTAPAKTLVVQRRKDATIIELTIYEGKKRQIRRMCEALKLTLLDLQRVRFGNLTLEGLKEGEYRELEGREIEKLKQLVK